MILSANPKAVELVVTVLNVHAAVHDAIDYGCADLDSIRDFARACFQCPNEGAALTCALVDAVLQAMIERGDIAVVDDAGQHIEPEVTLP